MSTTLGDLAEQFDCELQGSPAVAVDHVDSLVNANATAVSFLSNAALKHQLLDTAAGAVILRRDDAVDSPVPVLISKDPYATYARIAAVLHAPRALTPGVHGSAVVAEGASLAASAEVAAHAVVEAGAEIGEDCYVGPGCIVGPNCRLGRGSRLLANVTLVTDVEIGERVLVHPGAVIGADGFGNAMTPAGWVKVPQVGGVRIGDDVEIGANTTIDCGAIDDTVIGNGVRLDNLVMIAHNVIIGEHTAMAAQVGIAGSARIGARCLFAGHAGTVGHIEICDDVVVTGKTMITKSITKPGAYSAGWAGEPAKSWAKTVARVRRLGTLLDRVAKLEKDKR
ncbi:MAG: UDP-3-O-(3-hydroxymyristoyl)glucosamine N-acyltransferase [Pseudomonadota bacterium]